MVLREYRESGPSAILKVRFVYDYCFEIDGYHRPLLLIESSYVYKPSKATFFLWTSKLPLSVSRRSSFLAFIFAVLIVVFDVDVSNNSQNISVLSFCYRRLKNWKWPVTKNFNFSSLSLPHRFGIGDVFSKCN